jgi:hypothetical protein
MVKWLAQQVKSQVEGMAVNVIKISLIKLEAASV